MHLQAPVGPLQLPATLVDKAVRLDGNFKPKLPPPKTKTKKNPEIQRRDRLLSKFVARSIAPATTATVCCYVAPVLVLPFFSLLFFFSLGFVFFLWFFGLTAYPACVYAWGEYCVYACMHGGSTVYARGNAGGAICTRPMPIARVRGFL